MHIEEVTRPADPNQRHVQAGSEENVFQIDHQEATPAASESHAAPADKQKLLTSPAEILLNAEVKVNEGLTAPEATVQKNALPEVKVNEDLTAPEAKAEVKEHKELPDADVVVNEDLVGSEQQQQQLYEETGAATGTGEDYLDTSAYHDQAS
jgi:hypothetical protein